MIKLSFIVHRTQLDNIIKKVGELRNYQPIQPKKEPYYHIEKVSETTINNIRELKKRIINLDPRLNVKKPIKVSKKNLIIGKDLIDIYNKINERFTEIEKKYNEYKENIHHLEQKLERLNFFEIIFRKFLDLDTDLSFLKNLRFLNVNFGILFTKNIKHFEKAFKPFDVIFYYENITKTRSFFMVVYSSEHTAQINKILKDYNVIYIEDVHKIEIERLNQITEGIYEINEKINNYESKILDLLENNYIYIRAYIEILTNIEKILGIHSITQFTKDFAYLEGWIIEKDAKKLIDEIINLTNNEIIIFQQEIDSEKDKPPTRNKYPPIVNSFGLITGLYGLPNYKEIDPTLILTFTFPILFGLMFGDIGHGLCLLIGSLVLYFFFNLKESYKKLLIIIAMAGIASTISGFLYGEIFGYEITPLLFNPFTSLTLGLKFSILVGLIMIIVGITISGVNYYLRNESVNILVISIPKIILYVSCVYIVFVFGLDINVWLAGPIYIPLAALIILFIGRIILKILMPSKFYKDQSRGEIGMESVIDIMETSISVIGNLVSFTRIFIMSLIHIALLMVINQISGMVFVQTIPSDPVGILYANVMNVLGYVIIVLGNIMVIIFELLMVLIQDLRLHYYEWFTKFYSGDGIKFSPFSLTNRYGIIKIMNSVD